MWRCAPLDTGDRYTLLDLCNCGDSYFCGLHPHMMTGSSCDDQAGTRNGSIQRALQGLQCSELTRA